MQGQEREACVTSLAIRLNIERVVQEMVEQEMTEYLERDHLSDFEPKCDRSWILRAQAWGSLRLRGQTWTNTKK